MELKDEKPERDRSHSRMPPPHQSVPESRAERSKRRHHRRAKKVWRKKSSDEEEINIEKPKLTTTTTTTDLKIHPTTSKPFRKGNRKQVYLRPTNGPLLKAPKNSTQFIIDDHESSDIFNLPQKNQSSNENEAEAASNDINTSNEDDDNLWAEYSERDFETVYESAHQEAVSTWDKKKICDEIAALEKRQKELVNVLTRLEPDVYIQKLQSELISMQAENKALKRENKELNPALPDSSTNEDTNDGVQDVSDTRMSNEYQRDSLQTTPD